MRSNVYYNWLIKCSLWPFQPSTTVVLNKISVLLLGTTVLTVVVAQQQTQKVTGFKGILLKKINTSEDMEM